VKENGRHQLSASTIEKLDEAYKLVQDGTLVPASNFGGFTPEEFKVN
jgi:basic membrane protein A